MSRIEKIQNLLNNCFKPSLLEVIDDSHKHIGHAGNTSGAGHYTVKIKSENFANSSRIASHRMIYKALDNMIGPDIHALRIIIIKD